MPGKITEMTDAGTLVGTEYVEVVDDVGTTPVSRRTTVEAIAKTKRTVRIPHTWHIPGEVKVASGDTDLILPFLATVFGPNVSATVVAVRHGRNSGTSFTYDLRRAGATVTDWTGFSATSASGGSVPASPMTLTDAQLLAPVVTAVSGTPKNAFIQAIIDYTF